MATLRVYDMHIMYIKIVLLPSQQVLEWGLNSFRVVAIYWSIVIAEVARDTKLG